MMTMEIANSIQISFLEELMPQNKDSWKPIMLAAAFGFVLGRLAQMKASVVNKTTDFGQVLSEISEIKTTQNSIQGAVTRRKNLGKFHQVFGAILFIVGVMIAIFMTQNKFEPELFWYYLAGLLSGIGINLFTEGLINK
jgi:hypothetical protein